MLLVRPRRSAMSSRWRSVSVTIASMPPIRAQHALVDRLHRRVPAPRRSEVDVVHQVDQMDPAVAHRHDVGDDEARVDEHERALGVADELPDPAPEELPRRSRTRRPPRRSGRAARMRSGQRPLAREAEARGCAGTACRRRAGSRRSGARCRARGRRCATASPSGVVLLATAGAAARSVERLARRLRHRPSRARGSARRC